MATGQLPCVATRFIFVRALLASCCVRLRTCVKQSLRPCCGGYASYPPLARRLRNLLHGGCLTPRSSGGLPPHIRQGSPLRGRRPLLISQWPPPSLIGTQPMSYPHSSTLAGLLKLFRLHSRCRGYPPTALQAFMELLFTF